MRVNQRLKKTPARYYWPMRLLFRGNRIKASFWYRLKFLFTAFASIQSRNNLISIGRNFRSRNLVFFVHGEDNKILIGDDCRWNGSIIVHGNGVTISIGDRCLGTGVYTVSRNEDITIGNDCLLAKNVTIRSTDMHQIFDLNTTEYLNPDERVTIGNRVWIAANAFISKGTKISDGSVVGAGSYVNSGFEEGSVVIAGNPAQVIRHNVQWQH